MSKEREEHMELDVSRYLEGHMDGAEREEFEARLSESASLRAEVEVLRRTDEALRRSFGGLGELSLESAGKGTGGRSRAWGLVGALAAAAVLVLAALPFLTRTPRAHPPIGPAGGMSAEDVYALEASRDWAIEHVCRTDREFAEYSLAKLGSALVADASAVRGVEIVGWAGYDIDLRGSGLDGGACLIVARVEGAPVLVFLDPGGERNRLLTEGDEGLRVFRREVGPVSAYEVTPLEEPRVIGVFEEAPEGLLGG